MEVDDKEIWEVEELVNSRKVNRVMQYQVRWSGCTEQEDTWEKFHNLDNCSEKLREFREKFPRKLRDE